MTNWSTTCHCTTYTCSSGMSQIFFCSFYNFCLLFYLIIIFFLFFIAHWSAFTASQVSVNLPATQLWGRMVRWRPWLASSAWRPNPTALRYVLVVASIGVTLFSIIDHRCRCSRFQIFWVQFCLSIQNTCVLF